MWDRVPVMAAVCGHIRNTVKTQLNPLILTRKRLGPLEYSKMSQTHTQRLLQSGKFSHYIDSTGGICDVLKCDWMENKCFWDRFCALLHAIDTAFYALDYVKHRFEAVFEISREISHFVVFTKIAPNPSHVEVNHSHSSVKVISELNTALFRQKIYILAPRAICGPPH